MVLRKKVVERIEEIQTTFNLHDVWRVKNPQAKSFTWSQKSPLIFCRLDYWLISNSLQELIKDVNIIAPIRTDHSAIFLHLQEIEEYQRGPGFWKMKREGEEFSDVRVAWDWVKYNVRLFTINYSKEGAKTKREREEKLQKKKKKKKKMQIAQAQFQQTPCEEVEKIIDECKADLENFYEEKANGLIVRARARWHEYGEKSTKFF